MTHLAASVIEISVPSILSAFWTFSIMGLLTWLRKTKIFSLKVQFSDCHELQCLTLRPVRDRQFLSLYFPSCWGYVYSSTSFIYKHRHKHTLQHTGRQTMLIKRYKETQYNLRAQRYRSCSCTGPPLDGRPRQRFLKWCFLFIKMSFLSGIIQTNIFKKYILKYFLIRCSNHTFLYILY